MKALLELAALDAREAMVAGNLQLVDRASEKLAKARTLEGK